VEPERVATAKSVFALFAFEEATVAIRQSLHGSHVVSETTNEKLQSEYAVKALPTTAAIRLHGRHFTKMLSAQRQPHTILWCD
jgi:histidine ammonia-lyase